MNITISNEDLFHLNKLLVLKDTKIEELERVLTLHQEVCDRVNGLIDKSKRVKSYEDIGYAHLTTYKLVDELIVKYDLLVQENKDLKEKIKHLEEDFPK